MSSLICVAASQLVPLPPLLPIHHPSCTQHPEQRSGSLTPLPGNCQWFNTTLGSKSKILTKSYRPLQDLQPHLWPPPPSLPASPFLPSLKLFTLLRCGTLCLLFVLPGAVIQLVSTRLLLIVPGSTWIINLDVSQSTVLKNNLSTHYHPMLFCSHYPKSSYFSVTWLLPVFLN